MSSPSVTAKYTSPTGTHTFPNSSRSFLFVTTALQPNGTATSSEQQSAYLRSLRSSVATLQADINAFLTRKMEEDKGEGKMEDAKAEENYGEEVPDDGEENAR